MSQRYLFTVTCLLSLWMLVAGRQLHAQSASDRETDGVAAAVPGANVENAAPEATRVAPGAADAADALARLDAFMRDVQNFRADFEQTLYDADSEPLQQSTGTVVLMRPGRFDWRYIEPAGQRIVADGTRIWLYDPGLEQVTVNRIDKRVAGTPLVVLMGSAPLDEAFDITPLGKSDGIDWLELLPKQSGSDFETVYLGLEGEALAAMELRDSFGQATQIRFTDFEANVALSDDAFDFVVPDGVDVIGLEE